jgi:hypothetical protein
MSTLYKTSYKFSLSFGLIVVVQLLLVLDWQCIFFDIFRKSLMKMSRLYTHKIWVFEVILVFNAIKVYIIPCKDLCT